MLALVGVVAPERKQPSVLVRCEGCGDTFTLPASSLRHYRSRGREPRCRACRFPRELTDEERTRFQRWWLQRFSEEELVALADAIWGPRA